MTEQRTPPLPRDTYVLGRDYTAATRLNCQHYVWKQLLQYNLHPDIPSPSSIGARIADVATGTGAWLLEVAREFPQAQCDGFDISTIQCPPSEWLPANVVLREWNIFEPPPADLVGKYDVVHIRLVVLVIAKEPVPTIRNLAMLLKPGGYLQWDELNMTNSMVITVNDGIKVEALTKMNRLMKENRAHEWIERLPSLLNDHGFEDTRMHRVGPDMTLVKFETDMNMLAWLEQISQQAEGSEKQAELTQMIEDVYDESKQGAAHWVEKLVVVARKLASVK